MSTHGGGRPRGGTDPSIDSPEAAAQSDAAYARISALHHLPTRVALAAGERGEAFNGPAMPGGPRYLARQLEHNEPAQRMFAGLAGQPHARGEWDFGGNWPRDPAEIIRDMAMIWEGQAHVLAPTGAPEGHALLTAMRMAAEQEFGLRGTRALGPTYVAAADRAYGQYMGGIRALLRAMYTSTQETFRAAGIKSMVLYRGMHHETRATTGIVSTTARRRTAEVEYNDYRNVYGVRVPASRILSFAGTGMGDHYEQEVVMLGGTDNWHLVSPAKTY